jgi:hypothetical protein
LHEFIDEVQISLDAVAQALSDNYFWTGLATRHGALKNAA